MIWAFALAALAMIGGALAVVLLPLLRTRATRDVDRAAANVAVLRDQRAELEAELARGAISPEDFERARLELERRVLEDTEPLPVAASRSPSLVPALVLAGAIPAGALLLYLAVGEPGIVLGRGAADAQAAEHVTEEAINVMVAKLAARLANEPDDANGWRTLARSYTALGRHADAVAAFERAIKLAPGDADVLADYADSLGTAQGGTLAGRPIALVREALTIDPDHWKALALAGSEAFFAGRYGEAIEFWERVRAVAPPDSRIGQSIGASIAEARSRAAAAGQASGDLTVAAKKTTAGVNGRSGRDGRLKGSVTLTESLRGKVAPGDTVFVFARAAEGPRMPLAILKKTVKDLPFQFDLDDSMGMTPESKLSAFSELIVVARISRSGSATAARGDLEGSAGPVKIGSSGVEIVVDREVP